MVFPILLGAGIGTLVTLSLVSDKLAECRPKALPEDSEQALAIVTRVLQEPPNLLDIQRQAARGRNDVAISQDIDEAFGRFERKRIALNHEQREAIAFLIRGEW